MRLETIDQLRACLGHPSELTRNKLHTRLTEQAAAFIRRSPLIVLATSSRSGLPTASPKGDAPGFVLVEGDDTLYLPERRGNKLLTSYLNLLENPQAGLIFFVPGCLETLRVSGRAELLQDETLARRLAAQGTPALLTLKLTVSEAYFHCGKACLRSGLWRPETWPDDVTVSLGREIDANLGRGAGFADEVDAQVQLRYQDSLY